MLVAWYPLNKDTLDYSGNGNDAINNGSVISSLGKIGQCYSFNGTSNYLSGNNLINSASDFTIAFWTKLNATTNQCLFSCRTSIGDGLSIFTLSNTIRFDTGINYKWTTPYTIPDNTWVHVVVTKNSQYKKLYINGVLNSSTTSVANPTNMYTEFTIGASQSSMSSFDNFLNGYLNDYRIYDNALSDKEIYELSKAKILHYSFNDFQEPTENLACGTITYYSPYHTLIRDGQNLSMTVVDDNSYIVLRLSDISIIGKTYAISGYMKKNGIPYIFNSSAISTYQPSATLKEFDPVSGYFKVVQTYTHSTSEWLFHASFTGNVNEVLTIENLQVEEKDHITPFVNGSRIGIVRDCSGYKNDTTLNITTTPQWVNDSRLGSGCYKFSGNNNWMVVPNSQCKVTNTITLSAWAYRDNWQGTSGERILSCTEGGGWQLGFNDTVGYISMPCYIAGVGYKNATYPLSSITTQGWHHLAGVFDGVNVKFYFDGELKNTVVAGGTAIGYNATNGIFIGAEATTSNTTPTSGYWKGKIDDVRIYASALSDLDILGLYQNKSAIDNKGNLYINQIIENQNIAYKTGESINNKVFTNGLKSYTQSNCQVTLTDRGYRIYRPPNLIYPDAGNTMWGGLKVNLFDLDPNILVKGRKYRISFTVSGQSSNDITNSKMYFSNQMGWGGGGLTSVSASKYNSIGSNFQGSKEIYAIFNITDDIWKVCTTTYSSFVAGTSYNCYKDLCWGFTYQSTGALGTDLYITDFKVQDITDNQNININNKGVICSNEINEIGITNGLVGYWRLDGNTKNYIDNTSGTLQNYGTGSVLPSVEGGLNQKCYRFTGVSASVGSWINTGIKYQYNTLTLSTWLNWSGGSWSNHIATMGDNDYNPQISSGGNLVFHMSGVTVTSTNTITTNTWYHVVFVVSNLISGAYVKIYVNGEIFLDTTMSTQLNTRTYPNPLAIGQDWDGAIPTDFFNGLMQDVKIYNRVLGIDEVNILYKLGKGGTPMIFSNDGSVYLQGQIKEN